MNRVIRCGLTLFAVVFGSCISVTPHRLPLSGYQARGTFPRLTSCAQARGYQAVTQPESLNVKFDANTWIQYMIQNDNYDMVIVLDSGVPDSERTMRHSAAKAVGDELFVCSTQSGSVMVSNGSGETPVIMGERGSTCQSATSPACSYDGECQSQNCTNGVCQLRVPGSPCGGLDAHCDSANCTNFCCQARTPGSPCGGKDAHCDSLNCTSGRCQPRTIGSPCGDLDTHCDSLNCTAGRCQARGPGAPCGDKDARCDSFRCVNGSCN